MLAYRRYSLDYVDEEAGAQAARRGIWPGEFVKPSLKGRNVTPTPFQYVSPYHDNVF